MNDMTSGPIDFPVVATATENVFPSTHSLSTRWRLKWLWYRSCYTFLWAHHPLCNAFRKDVLRLGPVRVCRSCFCVYLGILVATTVCLTFFSFFRNLGLPILLAVLISTLLVSYPKVYKKLPRPLRDLARFAMGTLLPLTGVLLWTSFWPLALITFVLLYFFWRYYFQLRKIRRETVCESCHEYGRQAHCSGTLHQATSLRAYEESATAFLYALEGRSLSNLSENR